MARRSINRNIYEEKLNLLDGDPVGYLAALAKSPHRRHKLRAAHITEQARMLKKMEAIVADAQKEEVPEA